MDRRNFIKAFALAGAAVALKLRGAGDVFAQTAAVQAEKPADMAAVLGGEPDAMFRKAIAEMGGMGRFVKRGDKVVVKPNIGWDKAPELAANTNPVLVKEIVSQCFAVGAKEVAVFDNTCDNWKKCYENSGIEAAVKAAGGKMLPADEVSYYREISLPQGKKVKSMKVHQAILDCDAWINVPVLKNHGGASLSISMKNLMGIIWDRRFFHISDLQQCIADMCTLEKKPALNVVDAYRVLKTSGPRGKSAEDTALAKALFMSQDIVAVDTAATKFFGQIREISIDDVKHLALGQALKIGTMDIDKLNVKRIRM
ncbi:MAG: DUF362 domain-containing protein [Chitinispirillales bacterium]|jgi:uncharacterized protein (DUF362 family)|nr:DUF362 domain-containing protein [Chitinispirillales bacterium]